MEREKRCFIPENDQQLALTRNDEMYRSYYGQGERKQSVAMSFCAARPGKHQRMCPSNPVSLSRRVHIDLRSRRGKICVLSRRYFTLLVLFLSLRDEE